MAPLVHAAVPDAHQLCHAGEGGFGQIFNAVEDTVHKGGQHSRAALEDLRQVGNQRGGKLGNRRACGLDQCREIVGDTNDEALDDLQAGGHHLVCVVTEVADKSGDDLGGAGDQVRDVVNKALCQRAQHFSSRVQHGRCSFHDVLSQLGDDLHAGVHQAGQLLGNACRQIGENLACSLKHGFGSAIRQGGGQLGEAVCAPLSGIAQRGFQRVIQGDAEVLGSRLHGLHLVLKGVGHGLVGGLGSACAVLHLAEHIVEMFSAAGCQRQCTGACFHTRPQTCKGSAAAADALIQNLQNIA